MKRHADQIVCHVRIHAFIYSSKNVVAVCQDIYIQNERSECSWILGGAYVLQ